MLTFDLRQCITECAQKIVIGIEDRPVRLELDNGLRFVDCIHLSLKICKLQFFRRNISGEFHNLIGVSLRIENGVVAGLDPDFLATLAEPFEFTGAEFAACKITPELLVVRRGNLRRIDKHAVMLALNVLKTIPQGSEEITIGSYNSTICLELDNSHGSTDGIQFCLIIRTVFTTEQRHKKSLLRPEKKEKHKDYATTQE